MGHIRYPNAYQGKQNNTEEDSIEREERIKRKNDILGNPYSRSPRGPNIRHFEVKALNGPTKLETFSEEKSWQ